MKKYETLKRNMHKISTQALKTTILNCEEHTYEIFVLKKHNKTHNY